MEKYIYKGKNEEEILSKALEELNLKEEDIIYKTSEEKSGLFGSKKVILELVKINDIADYGKNLIEKLLENLKIDLNKYYFLVFLLKIREKQISYKIHSDKNNILIGKRGKILDSIQTFIKQSINSKFGLYVNVIIDVENYKEKQNYYLERDVKKIAREVTLSKVDVKLDPMNSYERRIVHNALSKFEYIETISEGEEPNRCVVIKYKEKDE